MENTGRCKTDLITEAAREYCGEYLWRKGRSLLQTFFLLVLADTMSVLSPFFFFVLWRSLSKSRIATGSTNPLIPRSFR